MSDVSDLIAITPHSPTAQQTNRSPRQDLALESQVEPEGKIRWKTCFSIFWNAFVSFHIRFRSLSSLKPEFHAVAADRSVSSHHVRGQRFDPRLILPITSQVNKLPELAPLTLVGCAGGIHSWLSIYIVVWYFVLFLIWYVVNIYIFTRSFAAETPFLFHWYSFYDPVLTHVLLTLTYLVISWEFRGTSLTSSHWIMHRIFIIPEAL